MPKENQAKKIARLREHYNEVTRRAAVPKNALGLAVRAAKDADDAEAIAWLREQVKPFREEEERARALYHEAMQQRD